MEEVHPLKIVVIKELGEGLFQEIVDVFHLCITLRVKEVSE